MIPPVDPLVALAIDAVIAAEGSLNRAADLLRMDAGNLSRILSGKRKIPDRLLFRLGIVRVITYQVVK